MSKKPRSKLSRVLIASIFSLVVVFTVWYEVEALRMRQRIAAEALREAERSRLLDKKIGRPIEAGFLVSGRVIGGDDGGTADIVIPISGPNGSGKLLDWSQAGYQGWHVCSLTFRPKSGPDIELFPDEDAQCERE